MSDKTLFISQDGVFYGDGSRVPASDLPDIPPGYFGPIRELFPRTRQQRKNEKGMLRHLGRPMRLRWVNVTSVEREPLVVFTPCRTGAPVNLFEPFLETILRAK